MKKSDFSRGVAVIFRKTVIVLSGLVLSLVLLEGGLRLGGFIFSSIQGYENLRSIKQKGAYRILCLGESTTAGQYPHLLERVLNQRNTGVRFSVIDKGRAAVNSITLMEGIESSLAEYHPDMVVVMMGINDRGIKYYQDNTESGTWLFKHCRTYRFGSILLMHILKKFKQEGIDRFKKADSDRKTRPESVASSTPTVRLGAAAGNVGNPGPRGSYSNRNGLPEARKISEKEDTYLRSGELYKNQGKFPQAEEAYRKALEIHPENDNTYVELGWLYRIQRKYSQAEAFFKKALELNPESDYACNRLGWLYSDQGKFAEAEDFYKKSIGINPKKENAYYSLGVLYRIQGKLPQAEDCFKQAIEIRPEDERTLGAISSLYEEMGKHELAKEYAERANGLRSENYPAVTVNNYRKLKEILDRRGIKLVCAQYPMRDVEPLKKIFDQDKNVLFVDNVRIFEEAVKQSSYKEYFRDAFAGDFGHCTPKGNWLLAQNIADVILREVFNK